MDTAAPYCDQEELERLVHQLMVQKTVEDKVDLLSDLAIVREYLQQPGIIPPFLTGLAVECEYAIKAVIAIGQGPTLFECDEGQLDRFERLRQLLQVLIEVERFYEDIGGIVGYHATFMRLLGGGASEPEKEVSYSQPPALDFSEDTPQKWSATRWGLENLPLMGELYAVGGAGDRLDLRHEGTGEPLPAAKLPFMGRTLIEGLLRDLQAREYLYFCLTGKRVITPIAFMTSDDKQNHRHILSIFEQENWFGRPRDSFFFFSQPGAPVITRRGIWVMDEPLKLALKPGGHGVLWRLAEYSGAFDWFRKKKRVKLLVRQVNNPAADTDGGLLPFLGIGLKRNKIFGFASCPRMVGTAEGINVLKRRGDRCCITNVEYTEFHRLHMEDRPREPGGRYSAFPANTNILFADMERIRQVAQNRPIPGLLVNAKLPMMVRGANGALSEQKVGRLESTMQNVADYLEDECGQPDLKTYLTLNRREKTLSTTKKSYRSGGPLEETPEGCFLNLMRNYREVLVEHCGMEVGEIFDDEVFVRGKPPFLASLHPALGPLYSIIAAKIEGGRLAPGSELYLEIAELLLHEANIQGSLWVHADCLDPQRQGRCRMEGVTIVNEGVDVWASLPLWRHRYQRTGCCEVVLHERAEFYASGVTIRGSHRFEVPPGHRLLVTGKGENWTARLQPVDEPTWKWVYSFDEEDRIKLKKEGG